MRRVLLGFLTALIVARPLVLGEDPGLLTPLSGVSNLVLSLLWLVAAVGWAGWRVWFRQETWRSSAVEIALFAVVILMFVSAAGAAAYKHPAWLIAWEWFILLVVFGLVRQLVRTPDENRGLLAALLATAVSLSAYAIYQYTVELPRMRAVYAADPEQLQQAMSRENLNLDPSDPSFQAFRRRLSENNVFATYAHPNNFAGYLALLLPALVGGLLVRWRSQGVSWPTLLTAACTLLVLLALWLTHSRGAILASVLVGAGVLLARPMSRRRKLIEGFLLVAVILGAVGVGFLMPVALGKAFRSLSLRLDYWTATWEMIHEYPWLGVGPGNFSRYYPRYMVPTAYEKIQDPHNFLLEMWAVAGLFALIVLLIALAALLRQAWRELPPRAATDSNPSPQIVAAPPWEFYLGGMAGLLLAFLLRVSGQSPDEILIEGLLSGARSVLWFAVFALLDGIPWWGPSRVVALLAGVAALLLNLLVSGGISAPSVAQPMWVVAALALNACAPMPALHAPAPAQQWLKLVLPLPLLAAACLAYLLLVFLPVTRAASLMNVARYHARDWSDVMEPWWREQMEKDPAPIEKYKASKRANAFLEERILKPLEEAHQEDPADIGPLLELAHWRSVQWRLFPGDAKLSTDAVRAAGLAQQLDPQGKEGFQAEYRLRLLFAQLARDPIQVRAQYGYAAKALRQVVQQDPTEARLRYQLAQTLFQADDRVQAEREAQEAWRLDHLATEPSRQLTDAERDQLRKWLHLGAEG